MYYGQKSPSKRPFSQTRGRVLCKDHSHLFNVNLCVDPQDPQYMQQALTNALLMDAVVGSLQSTKAIYAASKLAHFDRIKMEGRTDLLM